MSAPIIAGQPHPALAALLGCQAYPLAVLVNADPIPETAGIIARCTAFAEHTPDSLIVTLLPATYPGLANFPLHQAAATLWAFTRQAALDWAPRNIRVNAIAIGAAPPEDIARTVLAIADFASMTGQIIRLGG